MLLLLWVQVRQGSSVLHLLSGSGCEGDQSVCLVVVVSLHMTHVETACESSSLAPCEVDGSGHFVLADLSLDSHSCLSARSPGRCLWPSCC